MRAKRWTGPLDEEIDSMGKPELRRHRLFETSWPIALRPARQHGHVAQESVSVTGTGMGVGGKTRWVERTAVIPVTGHTPVDNRGRRLCRKALSVSGHAVEVSDKEDRNTRRRAISITGNTAQTNLERNTVRETFSADDARVAMGIDWMAMKDLSQAIPPIYAEFIGRLFLGREPERLLVGGSQATLF